MTRDEAIRIMGECFAQLSPKRLESLAKHAALGTPICCGAEGPCLTDGRGGGCPSVLACEADVPKVRLELSDSFGWEEAIKADKRAKQWQSVFISFCWASAAGTIGFPEALFVATQDDVRKAIGIAETAAHIIALKERIGK